MHRGSRGHDYGTALVGWIEDLHRCTDDGTTRIVADCVLLGSPHIPAVRRMLADGTLRLGADLLSKERDLVVLAGERWRLRLTGPEVLAATVKDPPAPVWPDLRLALTAGV